MGKRKMLLTVITLFMILSFTFTSAGAAAPADEGIRPDLDDPAQIYPEQWQTVFDKTPTFRFYQYGEVTKYRIKVRSGYDESVNYYTYKGTATCFDFECKLTPDIALPAGVVTYENEVKGRYQWIVEAKEAPGVWVPASGYVDFFLGTPGFNSQFTADKKGWVDLNGDWLLTSAGRLKNNGIAGEYTSTLYKKRIMENFTYTTMMKLKSVNPNHYGGVIINGNGHLTDGSEIGQKQVWSWGNYFVYRNNKQAAIFVWENGVLTGGIGWRECSSIVPNGWNEIEVTTELDTMYVEVNGVACMNLTHPSVEGYGYVGLTQYRYDVESEKMLVDWVKLEVDTP